MSIQTITVLVLFIVPYQYFALKVFIVLWKQYWESQSIFSIIYNALKKKKNMKKISLWNLGSCESINYRISNH